MPEYTDLDCQTPQVAQMVLDYLNREVADVQECESDGPHITGYVEKSTVRITYHDLDRNDRARHGWDMMLTGFRDGIARATTTRSETWKAAVVAARTAFDKLPGDSSSYHGHERVDAAAMERRVVAQLEAAATAKEGE